MSFALPAQLCICKALGASHGSIRDTGEAVAAGVGKALGDPAAYGKVRCKAFCLLSFLFFALVSCQPQCPN